MKTSLIAGFACAFSLWIALSGSAPGQSRESVIALPDAPFVIPGAVSTFVSSSHPSNVTTQLNNNARQGANLSEFILNPGNVRPATFGKLHHAQVQGQVLAQPLYVGDVDIDGLGPRSVVVVATAANIVYALDANDLSLIAKKQLTPDPAPDPKKGIPNRYVDISNGNSLVPVCAETYPPYIGVTSTPVIDAGTGAVFVVSFNSRTVQHELHELNLHDRFQSDKSTMILPPLLLPGQTASQWAESHRNRPGLLLSQGIIYVAFGSFICDNPQPYAGWVLGYRASDLKQVAYWETPNPGLSGSSGIWQSGRGLAASDDGEIYFMTGNDSNFGDLTNHTNDADGFNNCSQAKIHDDCRLANSFLKLSPSGPTGLELAGGFTPKNSSQLSAGDTDLGSSGPILLPGDLVVGGGKQGRVYVMDQSAMHSLQNHTEPGGDGFQGFQAFINNYHTDPEHKFGADSFGHKSCTSKFDNHDPDGYCRTLQAQGLLLGKCDYDEAPAFNPADAGIAQGCYLPHSCYQYCQAYGPNIHAGFVYWQPAPHRGLIYAMPEKEHVKAFQYDTLTKKIEESPVATSQRIVPDGMPGGALSLSANGSQGGILWVSMPNLADATTGVHRGSLVALDATDLHELWSDDCIWYHAKFNPPTVADGRVFLATFADPVADPKLAREDGKDCSQPETSVPINPPDLTKPAGFAWIIEYGLF